MERLIEERREIEQELKKNFEILNTNKIGMDEPLVGADGFPRDDVDLVQVRLARVQIIRLTNDFKRVTNELADELNKLHQHQQQQRQQLQERAPESSADNYIPDCSSSGLRSIAVVDAINPDSPAYESGLRRGDVIVSIGNVSYSSLGTLKGIQELISKQVYEHKDKPMEVYIHRSGEMEEITPEHLIRLEIVPRIWEGQGLLGCHIVPIQK